MNSILSARKKLTHVYLMILMIISFGFSIALYGISMREVDRSLARPNRPIRMLIESLGSKDEYITNFELEREDLLKNVRASLINRLVLVNFLVLASGWLLSSYLAKKTLEPINESTKKLERFTSDASHELKTPITAIRMQNEIAIGDNNLTVADAKQIMTSTIEELDKMTALTNGLLSLSKSNESIMNIVEVNIHDVTEDSIAKLKNKAKEAGVVLENIVDKGLKASLDPGLIEQVLVILLDNAINHSDKGSKIEVKAKRTQNTKVMISVKDYGSGIAAEDIDRVFDRFYQSDKSRNKSKHQGHGLGLSIAKQIIEQHGGRISVKSKPDKGSTFSFVI